MATKLITTIARDGTSQAGRPLRALEPGYVSVDERTTADLVAFAREYGPGLIYYGLDDQQAGNWGAFVDPAQPAAPEARAAFLAKIAAFMEQPERFDPSTSPELFRPHFVLFLAFIKLFQRSQAELNELTHRHLEFYYDRFLRMLRKRPIPDRLNLIFDLRKGANEAKVPGGARLSAGPDSRGQERIYTTDRDLIVNRARIAALRSVFIERQITGVAEARERRLKNNDLEGAVLGMLRIALGSPGPGDSLPFYIDGAALTLDKLRALDALTQLTDDTKGFWLNLYEIRDLMRLEKVAAEFKRLLDESSNEVEKTALRAQIAEQLDRIGALVKIAAQRHVSPASPPTVPTSYDPAVLAAYFDAALGTVKPAGGTPLGIAAYLEKIAAIQRYFFMTAENFHDVMAQVALQAQQLVPAPAWGRVDVILAAAHEEKIHDTRRQEFAAIGYRSIDPEEDQGSALARLIAKATGDASASDLDALLGQTLTRADLDAAVGVNDWERVYSILEVALSNRIGVPAAQKVEWLNLYPAQDATAIGPRQVPGAQLVSGERAGSQWATFGFAPPAVENAPPALVLGWAISSPLFELSQGTRDITLTLGFNAASVASGELVNVPVSQPFVFQISTAKGWVECPSQPATMGSYEALTGVELAPADDAEPANDAIQFELTIAPNVDPIVPLPAAPANIDSPWPVLRLMLRPSWDAEKARYVIRYQQLRGLMLSAAHVKVEVKGLKPLRLQNDQGALNPKKPFEPFGTAPAVGSRLLIGHPEVLTKKLDHLQFNFEWMGAPADLKAHYANYPEDNSSFTAGIALLDRSIVIDLDVMVDLDDKGPVPLKAAPLFGKETAAPTSITTRLPPEARVIDAATIPKVAFNEDVSSWPRYLQWELNTPDFQHEAYPAVAAGKAIDLAAAISNREPKVVPADYKVNPPYTPKLKSLSLDYSASVNLQIGLVSDGASDVQMFHVHPFGSCDIEAERTPTGLPFLPRYDDEGELYLGLADVSAPQTVSILFQMAEGSADPDVERQSIAWSYLDGDRWIPLDDRVLLDTTRGFINTGIVELALEAAAPSTRLRGGLYWIRATIARSSAAVCDAIALHPQAMSATFVDHDNAPDHFKDPLPPATVTKLAAPLASIAGVRQPYSSFGGRMAEQETMWATRVSERLRHKQRALSVWDHERLVLERFPEIYKAKCIPASLDRPGEVVIIVIPDIRNLMPSDPFEPKAPSKLLADIEEYLVARAPAFATVKARNAHYVSVRVRLAVRFRGPGNEAYYIRTLNDELNRFLSPWAYEEGADIAIGGKIYATSIADFADRRSYVDYVAGVELFRSNDGELFEPADSVVEGGSDDAVLVAARTHTIDVIRDAIYDENQMRGIGFMKLELDFIVA